MQIKPLSPADLILDLQNPRLAEKVSGQRDALRLLAAIDPNHLLTLARDIAKEGSNPSELPIVMPLKGGASFVVLEGNRRLTAIRALENPQILDGVLTATLAASLRRASQEYLKHPIEDMYCLVVNKRPEADHWIDLRHTGQNDGAGVVRWMPDEVSRFKSRNGTLEPYVQVMDMLVSEGVISAAERKELATTTIKRIVDTPEIKPMIGLALNNGLITFPAGKQATIAVFKEIVKDLQSGSINTRALNRKQERIDYISALKSRVDTAKEKGKGNKPSGKSAGKTSGSGQSTSSSSSAAHAARDYVIPTNCTLKIPETRIADIAKELRKLSLKHFCNANAVLLRVFIELSVDDYIALQKVKGVNSNTFLHKKLLAVIDHLVEKKRLTEDKAKPIRHLCQQDSFVSVKLLNLFIHSDGAHPEPTVIKAVWNTVQPAMQLIWA